MKPSPGLDVESFLKESEEFWQGALKSTPLLGGINKRSNMCACDCVQVCVCTVRVRVRVCVLCVYISYSY